MLRHIPLIWLLTPTWLMQYLQHLYLLRLSLNLNLSLNLSLNRNLSLKP